MKKLSLLFLCSCTPVVWITTGNSSIENSSSTSSEDSSTRESINTDANIDTSSSSSSTSTSDIDTSTSNADTSTSSNSTGSFTICGNSIVEPGEECDDGNIDQLDYCSNSCELPRRIFVSSYHFIGADLHSLEDADQACNDLIQKINIGGFYKAWLSNDIESPASRFEASKNNFRGIYILLNGTIIAENGWLDLVDGNLKAVINRTEKNDIVSGLFPWTSTRSNGKSIEKDNCKNWSDIIGVMGHQGSIDHSNNFWTHWKTDYCSKAAPIYCVEDY